MQRLKENGDAEKQTSGEGPEECNVCGKQHDTSRCPLLETVQKVKDKKIPSRARLTLPQDLALKEENGETIVIAKNNIPLGTQFGPLEAPRCNDLIEKAKFPLKVFLKDGNYLYLDTTDENKCNWMILVAPAKCEKDQNLIAYQLHQDIYFSTQRELISGEELRVRYSLPYGRKMATLEIRLEIIPDPSQIENLSDPNNNFTTVIPLKRKRGRPRKTGYQKLLKKTIEKFKQEPTETNTVDESVIKNLGARELGVPTEQEVWNCSQCSASFPNCLEFAKHLKEHYKPIMSSTRGRPRGKCQTRGKRKFWNKPRKEYNIIKIENPDLSADVTTVDKNTNCIDNDVNIDEETDKNTTYDLSIASTESYSIENEKSGGKQLIVSIQGDDGIDGDVEKEASQEQSSSEDINLIDVSNETGINRKRKLKSETSTSDDDSFKDKKYQFVSREISEMASTKYNLRTKRKALVLSDEEVAEQECVEVSDDEDNEEYDENSSCTESIGAEENSSLPTTVTNTVCNSLEPLSRAANEILSKLVPDEDSQETNSTRNTSKENSLTDNVIETEKSLPVFNNSQKEDMEKFTHITLLQNKCYQSRKSGIYKCDLCGKSFNKRLYLYRHIKKHTGEFTCKDCHKVFARKENMLKHNCCCFNFTASELEYSCSYCKKMFATGKLLERHTAKHTGEFTCGDCQKSYSTKDVLLNHACLMKPSADQYICNICGKVFTKETYLVKHLPVHTGKHSCHICGKWLRSIDSLTNHIRMCGQVKEIVENGQAKCPNCQQVFTDVSEFRRHQYEHTHAHVCETCGARFRNMMSFRLHVCQMKVLSCDLCDKVFNNPSNLQNHKLTHGETQHKCSKCGKTFQNKDSLEKHTCEQSKLVGPVFAKRKNSVKFLTPLICDQCGSMFSSTSSLNVHKNLHGEKKFVCDLCGKRFHRKDLLLEHHAVHGDPSFPCPTCHKLFKTKKSLDIHIMIHDGIKRYKCGTCGKEFFQKGNLQKHYETHKKDRKHICNICQKSFSTKEYLNVHLLEHTRGRIYCCGVCNRSFVKEHQLRSHHKMFHSNRAYSCKYCGLTLKLRHSLKRHLRKKHADFENEWKMSDVVNSMLITKETSERNADMKQESYIIPDMSATQGAEVLLAVANLGDQELKEAIVSGRAQIKQGSIPDTFEISVPYNCEDNNDVNGEEQIILTTEDGTDITLQNSFIQKQLEVTGTDGKQYQITLPVETDISSQSEGEQFQITLPLHTGEGSDIKNKIHKITIPLQEVTAEGKKYEISLEEANEQNDSIATESGQYHIISEISNIEEQQQEYEETHSIEYNEQYEVTLMDQPDNNAKEFQVTLPEQQNEMSENEQYQIMLSDEQNNTNLIAQTEDGQQIVISGQNLPVGTHHIVLNSNELQHITNADEIGSQSTLVLQEGTILQQENGNDVLLYVLTTGEQQQ